MARWQAPPASPEQEAFLGLMRTSALLEHGAAEALKPHGLTTTQYNVLRILRGAGPDGLCRSDVGARMIKPVPDVTRLLDRLEDAGLVARDRDARDRRYVTTRITGQGLELLSRLDRPVIEMHRDQLGHMRRQDLERLTALAEVARERYENAITRQREGEGS